MDDLLKIMKDESLDFETRWRAAYCLGLLYFAEPIDDQTVRITSDTINKLETYLEMLRFQRRYKSLELGNRLVK